MNNPALPMYGSQSPGSYAFNNPQAGGAFSTSPGPPFDHAQTPFQPGMIPNHLQRPSHPQHTQQPIYQQNPGQIAPFPQSNYSPHYQGYPNGPSPVPVTQAASQPFHPSQSQRSTPTPQPQPVTSAPADMNMAVNMGLSAQSNANLAQQAQMQKAAQMARNTPQQQQQQQQHQQQHQQQSQQPQPQQQQQTTGGPSQSPQSAARERARVSVLLEINTHLLQEVVSLQAQGKAGTTANQGQQSPTSPTSATDPSNALNNSPGERPKSAGGPGSNASKPASQEYADCMRRLQANLSYLAAIADAKKKVNGAIPSGPAIMVPPPQVPHVHDLYKKLNSLFPEAGQSAVNKALAASQKQNQNPGANPQQPAPVSAQG
ncbi:hypothetical protein LTR99_000049 [Exophiala xenobiotica]|uniref:Uncharacterized protein n=1 Tax=Vermiconidia calcicola TaxID=1690605 RepID=A0AAV9PV60_9PEZI|nr:hypothetical protein LTR92_009220 [Exophiala xenobiotica]KAK5530140.1 hypothetical protein LTR25_009386 [Vermiconidia calcicola]KAK5547460.1 hypothetical protein LTR23_002682 [Chaetothyriales sp. CCFEE 6169]KAK5265325.1 hypothetical protein LTR96_009227 [Exophiala xenobiotica]KAK5307081.1 hypothetical protein LTR99_000049 [Exophiala xenobiotica]